MANCKYDGTKIPSGVSTQGGYKTHGAFPVPCGTDSSAAAPAPQAEGTHSKKCLDQLYSSLNARCICGLDGLKVGATPAETAGFTIGVDVAKGKDRSAYWCTGCKEEVAAQHVCPKTAGEMAAEQLGHTRSCPALTPGNDEYCTCGLRWRTALQTEQEMHAAWRKRAEESEAAEAFAKQRVEQAERERDNFRSAWQEVKLELMEATRVVAEERAKVVDLERERDDLKESLRIARQAVLGILPRAEAAESELREMREAAEKLAKRLRTIIGWGHYSTIPADDLFIECGEELEAVERLLARKAGS